MAVSSSPSPIWQGARRVLSSTGGLTVPYTVRTDDDGKLIYSGKAVPTPGSAQTVVELFDVLAPYVRNEDLYESILYADDIEAVQFVKSKCNRTFRLTYSGQTEYLYEYANYTYMVGGPSLPYLGDPVSYNIPFGAMLCLTVLYAGQGQIAVRTSGGYTIGSRTVASGAEGAYNIVIPTLMVSAGTRIRVVLPSGATSPWYTVEASCGVGRNWLLHYVNAFGGWDTLPLNGVCRRTDSFERESVELGGDRMYQYYDRLAPQRAVSRVTQGARWELNTGILTDAQSRTFAAHVPGTTRAILYDGYRHYPVAVTDAEVQNWKTAENNGRVPASYTLTVELQQDLVRL